MNYKKLFFFIIASFLFFSQEVNAQNKIIPLNTILEEKSKLLQQHPYEKVYLQFDKPYYAVGDTIWFKSYITTIQHVPSPLSKIVYVELINSKDSLISSLKLPVVNSVSAGSIPLNYPDFKEGNYHIRAFTLWMLNDNQNYFFQKNIYVGNAIDKQLSTYLDLNGTITDKDFKINSTLTFKDDRLKPFSDKKVNWEVITDDERVARGKETTDANGKIKIDFSTSQKFDLNRGKLFTELDAGNDRILKSSFLLKGLILENDIQFFPEGGNLIAGIESKVAFKAINSKGLGVSVSGIIIDESGTKVADFKDQHLGMGKLSFTPEAGKQYSAKATFANGKTKIFQLPKINNSGITLTAVHTGSDIFLRILTNKDYLDKNPEQNFYLVIQNGGTVYYAAKGTLNSLIYSAKIPEDKFPSGISQITLLAETGLPIGDRLIFIQRPDDMKINVKTDLPTYKARQKVKFDINTSNGLDMTEGNYSIAVVDDNRVPIDENNDLNIYSSTLLTADLVGYIEQPNYYFYQVNDQKKSDLDVLMMTQGYHRYEYKDLVGGTIPAIKILPEQGISISGTIRKSNGMPLEKGNILFQIPDKHFNATAITDQNGRFKFENLIFKDSANVVINARNNINSKDLRIQIDGEVYPAIYPNVNVPDEILNLDSALSTYLKSSKIEHNSAFYLQEVIVKSTAPKKISHQDYSALTGLNMLADKEVSGEQLSGCRVLTDCLSGFGLTFNDQKLYLSRTYNQGLKVPIAIYVGENQVDPPYLSTLITQDIESIEVFNNDGVSGINRRDGTSGVLVVNMKVPPKGMSMSKAQLKDLFPPTNVLTFKPKGYAVERQFYTPKYSGPRNTLQRADIRSTIYWNPEVVTDKTGKAALEFFNSDNIGTYRVTIEGIDKNGNIGRTVYKYKVN
ncbi:MAG: carboxypeptidase-like regulatory domain-containing protein [Bacteroidetes bacterium]|nr:carboxypeptidase-like regulatory domain-containing protein [Bacteroidota bacterium]MBU1485400.1 carboxypeptidase-like regulatory domain-containing protein [Bacteroidota bacterium]MBU1760592.1 carboxypeptidase-like regulatory domain-containing protein [Bacteroidota bacterium]MBU2046458.1 carboxypeptidase-like regulatory domain-containing protein [Bacteroidota bacterium]MBU2268109.1 carboxypeptidase-like regulatory domain-containing protein [Bacteroidota bacterium]